MANPAVWPSQRTAQLLSTGACSARGSKSSSSSSNSGSELGNASFFVFVSSSGQSSLMKSLNEFSCSSGGSAWRSVGMECVCGFEAAATGFLEISFNDRAFGLGSLLIKGFSFRISSSSSKANGIGFTLQIFFK
ncbi:hypothetical protein OGAPHI_001441 [Ogataea philodendri]|uniref:Uncharacterized protein n=1 Tax=Ogataea philodendri TaxID=1378263 RepID=A0A9P8T8L1_9ASCO|nr:uncharacterized protein OGAPHI_001441 [Ogataea philodendri]KAH3669320.1 hypothetical protein OGAPHI_001441 [Ogataea philodendri]